MPGVEQWTVTEPEAGQKLIQFLRRRLSGAVPGAALQRWIRTGQVRVDGARSKPGTRLKLHQEVRVPPHTLPDPAAPLLAGQTSEQIAGHLSVVHEDLDLLVLAKPKGLPVHAGTGHQDCVVARLEARFADQPWKPALVHRLDRDTSGLLIVAKTYARLQTLHDLWRSGQVAKTYLAWVLGRPTWAASALLDDDTAKTPTARGEKMRVGTGKSCRTIVRTLHQAESASLLLVAPLTGRTHQIRVQLASRGHPLIGDRKYGGPPCPEGMFLHSWHIAWPGSAFHLLPDWPRPWTVPHEYPIADLFRETAELTRCPAP